MSKNISTDTIDFLKKNVLSVTELTRTNKLSEILNSYAVKESSEVYIVQNNKNKNAKAVIVNLEQYERLLKIDEIIEQAIDESVFNMALERKDDKADIPLTEAIDDEDFDLDYVMKNLDEFELDEE